MHRTNYAQRRLKRNLPTLHVKDKIRLVETMQATQLTFVRNVYEDLLDATPEMRLEALIHVEADLIHFAPQHAYLRD